MCEKKRNVEVNLECIGHIVCMQLENQNNRLMEALAISLDEFVKIC
jgi:hypothetical protein